MLHSVVRGETLTVIAKKYGVTVAELVVWNGIANPSLIRVGQQLVISKPAEHAPAILTQLRKQARVGGGPVEIFVTRALRSAVGIRPLAAGGRSTKTLTTLVRQAVGSVAGQTAVSGTFFWNGIPLGLTVVNGKVVGDAVKNFVPVNLDTLSFNVTGAQNVVSGYPVLVTDGKANVGFVEDYLKPRHPRHALCWNDREVFSLVVDGRRKTSVGVTMAELADIAAAYGATTAVNLDGGGTAEMLWDGKVANRPSDGKERPMAVGLLYARR